MASAILCRKMDIHTHLFANIPKGWENTMKECERDIYCACKHIEDNEFHYVPSKELVFAPLYSLEPKQVNVVIVGQDPYPTPGHANGHSFSCNVGVPPSLKAIYKEIKRTHPDFVIPKHGKLDHWVKQGVLLLNMCPVFVDRQYTAKQTLRWMGYIQAVIETITKNNKNVIWALWGNKARELAKLTGRKFVLECGHPSPINQERSFDTCGHFFKINEILVSQGKPKINWNL